jgi:hypothetical protein
MSNEPNESMPEGEPHAVADYLITLIASAALIIGLIALAWPDDASAAGGDNWCASWRDGYEASFYLVCRSCQTIEPKPCPEPEPTDSSGYMRGVKDGAADGKQKQREWI